MYKQYAPFDPFTPFDANSLLRQGLIVVADAAERAQISGPTEGMQVYRLDTHAISRYNGATWEPDTTFGWGIRETGVPQTGITGLTELINMTAVFTLQAVTLVNIFASFDTASTVAADTVKISIRDDATVLRSLIRPANAGAANVPMNQAVIAPAVSLPAGTHRINIAIERNTGTGQLSVPLTATTATALLIERL